MPETTVTILIILAAAWIALVVFAHRLRLPHLRENDPEGQMLVHLIRAYARIVHRLRIEGSEHIPSPEEAMSGRGLIVAANHTAGVDPLLIQAVLPFEPRWMMAEDMRAPSLEGLWRKAEIIFVDRTNGDSRSVREALRHLKGGNVLGVFPEGYIERPAGHLLPFRPGIGLLIRRSGAPVLPVVVEGTPDAPTAWASLWRPSRSRVRVLPLVHYEEMDLSASEIASDLHARFAQATGWPDAPRIPIITASRRIYVDPEGWYVDEQGRRISDGEARAIAEEGREARRGKAEAGTGEGETEAPGTEEGDGGGG